MGLSLIHILHKSRVEATCIRPGNIEYYTCTGCDKLLDKDGQEITEDIEIPALGHDFTGEWTVTKPATCTESGVKADVYKRQEFYS